MSTVDSGRSSSSGGISKTNRQEGSSNSSDEPVIEKSSYTMAELANARAPTFWQRAQYFFFMRGLADRPEFLQNMYLKTPRHIYTNHDLPDRMFHKNSRTRIIEYPRNKIRTTKYTPLSFVPKNLLLQFQKVANSYFLFMNILGAFQVFGVANPGLAAVPLIVIVCITAAKDGFEDYRRSESDMELNNSGIHLLQGYRNVNVDADTIGPWRRFKKACSRFFRVIWRALKSVTLIFSRKKRVELARKKAEENDYALRRMSTIYSDYSGPTHRRTLSMGRRRSTHQVPTSRNFSAVDNENNLNPILLNYSQEGVRNVARFKNRKWKDINVGDFVRVRVNEEIPADIVLISTADPEGNCFVETKNLDGETNLKTKTSLHCWSTVTHARDLGNLRGWIECDAPNSKLYSFKGTMHYDSYDTEGNLLREDEKEPITNENILLRGCMLRNTKWAIGIVVYTGLESKIMMNSGISPVKISKISSELNLSIVINFAAIFVLCFISGVINGLFYDKTDTSRVYFEFAAYSPTSAGNGVLAFFVALIIYQSLVPISLYISIEIIKSLQAFFIYADVKLYYDRLNFPCTPKLWSISDDLGQIEYIFSDKTGTLTQNVMEFKKCTIGGKLYGLAYTEAKQGMDKREGIDTLKESEIWEQKIKDDKRDMIDLLSKVSNNDQFRETALTFVSSEYVRDILEDENREQGEANERFMKALALCHTVVTEDNEVDASLRDFKAESPDEAALVAVARDLGIVFKERTRKSILIEIYGDLYTYELLHIVPFTSARKRMSCILKSETGEVTMYTKGADNVIFNRLDPETSDEMLKRTALHLEDFAKEGLRTLCITQKVIDEKAFLEWLERYKEANASIDDSKDAIIDELNEELETDLTLLGGTAIEDRLQPGVPDSISILASAGIKLWVLTGDRIETAINIGFSCNLLGNDMKLLVVRPGDDPSDVGYIDNLITSYLSEYFGLTLNEEEDLENAIKLAKLDHSVPKSKVALIIDGAALSMVFHEDPTVRKKFVLLGKQCKSVICCRVSPAQKAEVVTVVKENLKVMTLAIGDGANDVAMIQAANIGIGIAGEEGRQAVMSSDYAIGQFRFLTRLLLVHGRWSYKRLAEMVPAFFYKNVVFTLTCFFYGIYTDFDGSYLYEYTYLMFYNLAFTSLPVIILAVFDQDVSDSVSMVVPQLYRAGILGEEWSQYKFLWYMLDGLYQSVISYFFPYLMYYVTFQNHEGLPVDHRFWVGVLVCAVSVTACNLYVLLQQKRWDWLTLLINALSILVVFFWTGVWSARAWVGEFYKSAAQLFGTLGFWCVFPVGVLICLLPRFLYDFWFRNFSPRDIDIIRERAAAGDYKDYPEAYDPTNPDDIEKQRILRRLNEGDTALLKEVEKAIEDENQSVHSDQNHKIAKAFKSIKRRATISRSRKNTVNSQAKYNKELMSKPLDLEQLRLEMIRKGEYKTAGRNSLERVTTTHGLPGLTQAETLMTIHTRNSINFLR